jgi:hypothetical protein
MRRAVLAVCLAACVASGVPARAQQPDFTGTWVLDRAASQIVREAALTGLGPTGAPDTLHITHAANGTIVVGSEVNESQSRLYQSRLYRSGAQSALPLADGGTVAIAARLDGLTLVADGTAAGGASLKEVHTLSSDRQTLTIAINATSAKGATSSTLVYRRTTKAAPCQTWPTPCRP